MDQDTTTQLLRQARLDRFEGAPLLEPAIALIKELKEGDDFQGAGLLRTWLAGGFWTQEQLFQHGAATTPLCAMCRFEEGTPSHRIFRCLFHAAERQDWCGDERRLLAQGRIEYGGPPPHDVRHVP